MTDTKSPQELVELLDEFMVSLLEGAHGGKKSIDGEVPEPITLAERTKAFDAAVRWMGERSKIAPTKGNAEPPIARLKSQLASGDSWGGGVAAPAPATAGSGEIGPSATVTPISRAARPPTTT